MQSLGEAVPLRSRAAKARLLKELLLLRRLRRKAKDRLPKDRLLKARLLKQPVLLPNKALKVRHSRLKEPRMQLKPKETQLRIRFRVILE